MTTQPDYPDFTGARAGVLSAQPLAQAVTAELAAGQASATQTYQVTQLGYELAFHLTAAAGGTGPDYATLLMVWMDSASGIPLWEKGYTIAAGPNGEPHRVTASGPARADTLQITVTARSTNPDEVTSQYTVLQTSRSYSRDRTRTRSTNDANYLGLISGNYVIEAGNLLNTSPNLGAAGGVATRVISFWDGQAFIKARTFSGAADLSVSVQDTTGLQSADTSVFHGQSDSGGYLSSSFYLPSLQCVLVLTNGNAAAQQVAASVTAAEVNV